ncbi:hypothetical protein QC334_06070 [Streptomyces sp. DH18]|uniref:hypothetical protein n=1 Tax=Streptomyces sp. DH18 TaxID=3040126 RepID=UPI00244268F8|nr:hypothetical protein [Streptomyces sp. DH18]MDG9682307.1 hypothetical protein [Streptomyces sp. DH18]
MGPPEALPGIRRAAPSAYTAAGYLKRGVVTFPLTTQVLRQETWTPELLEKRQSELLGLLADEWRL